METIPRLINSFQTKDESGKTYSIDCFQDFTSFVPLSRNSSTQPGKKSFKCHLGPVNRIDDQTFYIISTDTVVKKILC
jgi:hypothetical protein